MRGGKDEDKVRSPMFPRLHVNDRERGGPRAPPRNKMALYEQLNVPLQWCSPGSASVLPLPANNGATLVHSTSSSTHDRGPKRSPFTLFGISHSPSLSTEKHQPCSSSDFVLDISPCDAVEMIGEKHFWEARKAIVTQQRDFAMQVFELHRLIKVQRLILEDHLKGSLAKKLSSESILEPSPFTPKSRNDSQNPNPETKCGSKSASLTLPLHKMPSYAPFPTVTPNANKPSPWYFHSPLANQWLVPVTSPSEGLVYKSSTEANPSNGGGLMTPFFWNYEPLNGDFLNTRYVSHPYLRPLVNPSVSGSSVEHENQLSNVDINLSMTRQLSRSIGKQTMKESELLGSTSIPLRGNGEALPLFPMASDLNARTLVSEQPLKVVPHNPRSATESAARIFQSIQEGRRQCD